MWVGGWLGALRNLALQTEAGRDVPGAWRTAMRSVVDPVLFKAELYPGFIRLCIWLLSRAGNKASGRCVGKLTLLVGCKTLGAVSRTCPVAD